MYVVDESCSAPGPTGAGDWSASATRAAVNIIVSKYKMEQSRLHKKGWSHKETIIQVSLTKRPGNRLAHHHHRFVRLSRYNNTQQTRASDGGRSVGARL